MQSRAIYRIVLTFLAFTAPGGRALAQAEGPPPATTSAPAEPPASPPPAAPSPAAAAPVAAPAPTSAPPPVAAAPVAEPAPFVAPPEPPPAVKDESKPKKPQSAFAIESENGDHRLELHALIQGDGRFFFPRTG